MTRTSIRLLALLGGLGGSILPGAAWAHHPGPGGEGSWGWVGILAVILAAVIWPVLAFLERRQKPPSKRRPSKR